MGVERTGRLEGDPTGPRTKVLKWPHWPFIHGPGRIKTAVVIVHVLVIEGTCLSNLEGDTKMAVTEVMVAERWTSNTSARKCITGFNWMEVSCLPGVPNAHIGRRRQEHLLST